MIARAGTILQCCLSRVAATVTETNIHYPTDSSLLGDGVRVLTRVMKRMRLAQVMSANAYGTAHTVSLSD